MSRWTAADIPDQTGHTAIVTGANTGLGFETAAALAVHGAHVVLASRDLDKGARAQDAILARSSGAHTTVHRLDLASLHSVHSFADEIRSRHTSVDLLINNAGVSQTARNARTADGFELLLGTNHLGHFALTGLLLDVLQATQGSRVVTVSSSTHRASTANQFDDLAWEERYQPFAAYGRSKLANLLFTYELQRRLQGAGGAIAVAAHPGGSATDLMRAQPRVLRAIVGTLLQSPEMGALPTLRAATDPAVLGGQFYGPDGRGQVRGHPKVVTSSDASYDIALQQSLWRASEDLTDVRYAI